MKRILDRMLQLTASITLVLWASSLESHAQESQAPADSTESWSFHFQYTGIEQYHGNFPAKYSGDNSLQNTEESPYSVTATIYLGRKLWKGGALYIDPEMSGGSGFSSTRGVAGFPNGEVYRIGAASPLVFLARAFLRQHIALSEREGENIPPDQDQLAGKLPKYRLTLTLGRFGLTDIFDNNAFSHDPRTQFMNWALWAPGAWDYAADTRGYTWGAAVKTHLRDWILTLAAVLVPREANGYMFDAHINKAYSLNMEVVRPYQLFAEVGKLHLIGFWNRARMGNYRRAIDEARAAGQVPNIILTRTYCSKVGLALDIEQPLSETVGLFSRLSWNDGATESWMFTEIDRSVQIGASIKGTPWHRDNDNVGIAYVANALSKDHRDYLAAGGYGFVIGDGALNYGLEQILECFYSAKLSWLYLTLDNQLIINPGYNKDRGPVVEVIGLRGHVEF